MKIKGGENGRKLSEETREKLRQSRLGEKNPNYGKLLIQAQNAIRK